MDKILVIEDTIDVLRYITESLNVEGYECIGAENGDEGIKIAQTFIPDLIICDIMMPDMDGYEVLDRIKQYPSLVNTPFIFLTALSTIDDRRKGMDSGADDYLTKPISYDQLISAVQARLSKKDQEKKEFEKELKTLQDNISNSIPHELLSPINNILGIGNLMFTKARDLAHTDIENFSRGIINSGDKLLNIIKKFIYYTEIEINLASLDYAKTYKHNLTTRPDLIIRSIINEIADKYGRLEDCMNELENLILKIDENHFMIIVNELIDNAFKFSERDDEIVVKLSKVDNIAELSIFNKGTAISPENLSKIGAFRQFDRDVHNQEGIGLGLTIVRRFIDFYEGRFYIENAEDNFVNVTATIPIKEY